MNDYKEDIFTNIKIQNTKWVNADENKFIRFGQTLIEKNKEGIVAFINPHTYLDNETLRGMRGCLLDLR